MSHQPITKTIGGVTFEDPCAWLHPDTPEALDWQWERDAEAVAYARAWPGYEAICARMKTLVGPASWYIMPRKHGGVWFSVEVRDGVAAVVAGDAPVGGGRVITTAAEVSARSGGGAVMLIRLEVSPKGTYAALCYGVDGDMMGAWSVYEVASGRHLLDTPAIAYSGARPGWLPDESGFYLDGRNAEGLHELRFVPVAPGVADRASIVLAEHLVAPTHSGLTAQLSPDGRHAVLVTEPHEHIALVLLDTATGAVGAFLPDGWEGECDGAWLDDDTYLARVADVARGRVVAIPAATSRDPSTWREIVAEGEGFMTWAGLVGGRLYVGDLVDVSLRIRVFDLNGRLLQELPLEQPGSAPSFVVERAIRPTEALVFSHATFARSAALFLHRPDSLKLEQLTQPQSRLDDVEIEQRFVQSTGGARVPYFIIRRRDLDRGGPQPAMLHGYGGFNIPQLPSFPIYQVPFIEAGGVYVHCCLRGGSEYGKPWHDAGRLHDKQNTFDDLFAIAEAVIAEGISTPELMAFQGGSNGGLLAGVAAVQRPDLWRVSVPVVPIFDMMEPVPLTPELAGIRAIFYEDYGDPTKPEDAPGIMRWSPYHNIKSGTAYPAVFQVFGETDLGCMPFHGRKFTARLREATTSGHPVHLRVWRNVGHGAGDPEIVSAQTAEWLSFVMRELGMRP